MPPRKAVRGKSAPQGVVPEQPPTTRTRPSDSNKLNGPVVLKMQEIVRKIQTHDAFAGVENDLPANIGETAFANVEHFVVLLVHPLHLVYRANAPAANILYCGLHH